MSDLPSAVYDCNIFLQAVTSPNGPSGRCVQAVLDRHVSLFISRHSMNEFLEVGSRPSISIKFRLPKSRLEDFAQRVEGAAIRIEQVPTVFTYSRDVTDAHYINLAIAAGAHWIVSRDRDLLDLMSSPHRESELFRDLYPSLRVVNPVAFMTEHNLK